MDKIKKLHLQSIREITRLRKEISNFKSSIAIVSMSCRFGGGRKSI